MGRILKINYFIWSQIWPIKTDFNINKKKNISENFGARFKKKILGKDKPQCLNLYCK